MKEETLNKLICRRDSLTKTFPYKNELIEFLRACLSLFIPFVSNKTVDESIQTLSDLGTLLFDNKILEAFEDSLPLIQELIISDAESIYKGDPAAKSLEEVFLCYPGFWATATHRVAHAIHQLKIPLMPRVLSEYAHQLTGIDIHPAASIGKNFCIDHGTGIVIGETCTIGENVKIYQGVTLGALSVKKSLASTKRHPTIEDNVVIYANATLLGPITIGSGTVIGGNVWIERSVEPNSTILKDSK